MKDREKYIFLIEKFHIDPKNITNWGFEIKIVKQLIKKYGFDFLKDEFNIGYKVKSLIWFIGGGKNQIKEEWTNSRMSGTFASIYLSRAENTLIRVDKQNHTCDLTQTGDALFDRLLNNEPTHAPSK